MAADLKLQGVGVIAVTLFIALVLTLVSLPESVPGLVGYVRPQWVALVLIYWAIALPQTVGLGTAWFLGLLVDVLTGSLLGQHALVFVAVVAIALAFYQRMRMFSVWQQGGIVFAIMVLAQLLDFWINSLAADARFTWWVFLPSFVSALLWPWIFLSLRFLRRRFGIT